MKLLPQLSIAQKLPLVVVSVAFVVGAAIAGASYYFASQALEDQARQNLSNIAFERANQLQVYLGSVQEDLRDLGQSEILLEVGARLDSAFQRDAAAAVGDLQKVYIADNPNPPEQRLLLDRPAVLDTYGLAHSRLQPVMRERLTTKGYRDIYFFDEAGNLLYTTQKAEDFATSFAEGGPFADTGLGAVYREALKLDEGNIAFADFSHYAPLGDVPVAFFGTPVFNPGGKRVGVVAYAVTAERLSSIIGYRTGLGGSGDVVVVGVDGMSRSDSRITPDDDVLQPTIFDPVIRDAVTGVPGDTRSADFRGNAVLASAAPVDVTHNQSWGLVAVINTDEILAPIMRLGYAILIIGICLLCAAGLAGWLFSRTISQPITRLTRSMGELAEGNLEAVVEGAGRGDEVGAMARSVEVFRENGIRVQQMTEEERMNEDFRRVDRAEMMQALQRAFGNVVDAAVSGDFTRRVSLGFDDAALNGLGRSVNNLVETVERNLGQTGHVLAALAHSDLTERMRGDFQGSFAELRDDLNKVGETLASTVTALRFASKSLKTATGEILSGATDLSERTTRQAETIEETSAAIQQLTATVVDNAARAAEASLKAQSVSEAATEGGEVMRRANEAMERITASSDKISNIIGLIDDIAFQTNLLALNASVEAARAGEAGRGFAVVAVEVRRLAQSAAQASSEVKALIQQSETEVKSGNRLVGQAAEKLLVMLSAARESSGLIEGIARASREQAAGIEDVSAAVRKLDTITQHNAALVEETNAALASTEAQASELDLLIDRFTLESDSSGASRAA